MMNSAAARLRFWAFALAFDLAIAGFLIASLNSFENGWIFLSLLALVAAIGLLTNVWGGLTASAVSGLAIILINQYVGVYTFENLAINVASELVFFLLAGPLAGLLAGEIRRTGDSLAHWVNLAEQRATHDELFDTLRPEWSRIRLEEEVIRARRFKRPLSVALLQMSARINTSSRPERVAALQALVRIARSASQPPVVVTYLGSDTILLVLPEHGPDEARRVLADIQDRVAREVYFPPEAGSGMGQRLAEWGAVNFSIASLEEGALSGESLLAQAEAALNG